MSNNRKLVITAVIAFLIGFGVSSMWNNRSADYAKEDSDINTEETSDNTNTSITTLEDETVMSLEESQVFVNEQEAGSTVIVEKVVVSGPVWVAIHEDTNGVPLRILGARYFLASESNGVIKLLRSTVAGGTYYAMIHADNGDRKFDAKIDLPLLGKSGQPIMMKFVATAPVAMK